MKGGMKKLWRGLILLILISPLGLILPRALDSGPAWGEWGLEEIGRRLGYVPEELKRIAQFWPAPVPDYQMKGFEGSGWGSNLAYILCGILGVALIVLFALLLGRALARRNGG